MAFHTAGAIAGSISRRPGRPIALVNTLHAPIPTFPNVRHKYAILGPRLMRRLPKYGQGFIDRHGKARFYFRRADFK